MGFRFENIMLYGYSHSGVKESEQVASGHESNFNSVVGYSVSVTGHSSGQPEVMQQTTYYPFGYTLEQSNYYSLWSEMNKNLYNGKELQDDELGGVKLDWYDYGARFYDPVLGRWHVVDPLIFNHMDYTPYAYCYNNPVKLIDPFGLDTLIFNQNGKYAGNNKIIKAKGEDVGKVLGDDGYVFSFADPENDSKAVKKGEITQVTKVSDDAIANVLEESGVTDVKNQKNKFTYIRNESNATSLEGEGKMDYAITAQIRINGVKQQLNNFTLYVTTTESGTVAHNNYNFGNFLWGAGTKLLGFSEFTARLGAHYNNFFNDPSFKGTLDSNDDQYSIHLGFEYLYLRW